MEKVSLKSILIGIFIGAALVILLASGTDNTVYGVEPVSEDNFVIYNKATGEYVVTGTYLKNEVWRSSSFMQDRRRKILVE